MKTEFKNCPLDDATTIVYNVTKGEKITVLTDKLPAHPEFSMVHKLNLWIIRNRIFKDKSYEVGLKNLDDLRVNTAFEQLTFFSKLDIFDSATVDAKPLDNVDARKVGPNPYLQKMSSFENNYSSPRLPIWNFCQRWNSWKLRQKIAQVRKKHYDC